MTFTAALLSTILCAITWFEADGVTPKNQPAYVWPPETAEDMVKGEINSDPSQKAVIDCKEQ